MRDRVHVQQSLYPIENLVLEGGVGIKNITYVGALKALEKSGLYAGINNVTAISGSAIVVMLIGLGYSVEDIEKIIPNLNFLDLIDHHNSFWLANRFKMIDEVMIFLQNKNKKNVLENNVFNNLTKFLVEQALPEFGSNATFGDLKKAIQYDIETKGYTRLKNMIFIGINILNGKVEYFSFDNPNCLDMPIALAAKITMSFPGAFEATKWKDNFYIDGGMEKNLLAKIYNKSNTLILKIDMGDQIYGFDSIKSIEFIEDFLSLVGITPNQKNQLPERRHNVIKMINEDFSAFDFSNKDKIKEKLIHSGQKNIEGWLIEPQSRKAKTKHKNHSEYSTALLSQNQSLIISSLQNKLIETIRLESNCLELHHQMSKNIINLLGIKTIEDIAFNFLTLYQDILVKIDELENKLQISKKRQDSLEPEYLEKISVLYSQKNALHYNFNLSLKHIEGLEITSQTLILDFISELIHLKKFATPIDPSITPLPTNLEEVKNYLERSQSEIHNEIERQTIDALKLKAEQDDLKKDKQAFIREQGNLYWKMGAWVSKHPKVTYCLFNWLMRVTPIRPNENFTLFSQENEPQHIFKYLHEIKNKLNRIETNIDKLTEAHKQKISGKMLKLYQNPLSRNKTKLSLKTALPQPAVHTQGKKSTP